MTDTKGRSITPFFFTLILVQGIYFLITGI